MRGSVAVSGLGAWVRFGAVALLGIGYVLGSHWLMTRAQPSPWNVVVVLAPMLVALAAGAWRNGQRMLGAAAVLVLAGLGAQALLGLRLWSALSPQMLYLAQHAGIHTFLAFVFGSTLRAGHTPLITTLARRVHTRFTAAMAVYTRHCTLSWAIYFGTMTATSLLLYASAPFDTWAFFANLLTPVSLGAMFIGEYLLRYRLHPEFERASLADAIRSYRQGGSGS